MLADDKTRAAHFLSAEKKNDDGEKKSDDGAGARAHAVFLGLLASPDWFTREKAVFCLTRLIDQRPARDKKLGLRAEDSEGAEDVVPNENESVAGAATIRLVRWLCRELTAPAPSHTTRAVPSCVAALASLLSIREVRPIAHRAGAVDAIAPLLRRNAGPHDVQEIYEAALCAWLLTFHPPARDAMARLGCVRGLMDVAGTAAKEKVARVATLALRNLARFTSGGGGDDDDAVPTTSGSVVVGTSLAAQEEALRKLVQNLRLRDFHDEELLAALTDLEDEVLARRKEASSWDRYAAELMSGTMDWTAAHTDEGFWRENASKLTDNNCRLLRTLVAAAGDAGADARTLAVACHDLGEFATHYPAGRFLVHDLKGKECAMRLLAHANDEVRKQALLCTQKLLVAKWQFLDRPGGGEVTA
jgi:V-type H+-transporting ATPase subunit H